jgi:hypothetical protein
VADQPHPLALPSLCSRTGSIRWRGGCGWLCGLCVATIERVVLLAQGADGSDYLSSVSPLRQRRGEGRSLGGGRRWRRQRAWEVVLTLLRQAQDRLCPLSRYPSLRFLPVRLAEDQGRARTGLERGAVVGMRVLRSAQNDERGGGVAEGNGCADNARDI